jgi:cation diffusion facilitator CzcD-associated flavoprotein CzcO
MEAATRTPARTAYRHGSRTRPRSRPQRRRYDVVVIGAGAAGLSSALALKDIGLRPLVLERSTNVGASWRKRYDRLRLNSARRFSHLPGRPFPPGTPMFPTRDQLIAHLERHSREPGMEFLFGANVQRIDRGEDGWLVRLDGGIVRARQLIVATGYDRVPQIPEWPGRDRFEGSVIHSSEYRNPDAFRGRNVLVAGPGSSGMEIAYDLAQGGAGKVWVSARTAPNILLREGPGGLPGDVIATILLRFPIRFADAFAHFGRKQGVGDLTEYGLPVPEEGVFARLRRLGVAPAIVDGTVIEAIRERRIEIVPGVEALDARCVRLAGGEWIEPDAVIAATGYGRGLEPFVGHLGVLGDDGLPSALGEHPAADGLRFVGYVPRPGMLGYAAKEAIRAARAISRELEHGQGR